MSVRLDSLPKVKTPSEEPFPVFAMCPPVYVDDAIQNNPTMKEYADDPIDRAKFTAQWFNLYNVIASDALVYLITPVHGLQDQVYVNSFCYLPHLPKDNVIILSNFTGEGRAGEEKVAGGLFEELGYDVVKCPFKFEGDAELKYLRDDIYLGGWGFRTDPKAYKWLKQEYEANIIPIQETNEVLYHLDCSVFVLDQETVMACTEIMDPATVKQIEKVATIVPVSEAHACAGIANSLRVNNNIHNSSALAFMRKTDKDYEGEKSKNERLEKICREMGFELTFHDLSESEKSGAKLSCLFGNLTSEAVRYS